MWTHERISTTQFFRDNGAFFGSTRRGDGFYIWKPYIIRAALLAANPGDFVVYVDSSRHWRKGFEYSVVPVTNWLSQHINGVYINAMYDKKNNLKTPKIPICHNMSKNHSCRRTGCSKPNSAVWHIMLKMEGNGSESYSATTENEVLRFYRPKN